MSLGARVSSALPSDADVLASIYCSSFPEHTRARLGAKVCGKYFEKVIASDGYEVLVSKSESHLTGFSVVHVIATVQVGRRWMLGAGLTPLLKLSLRDPGFVSSRLLGAYRKILRRKKSWSEAEPPVKVHAYLDVIAVLSGFRRQGAAKELIEASLDCCRRHGLPGLRLTVEKKNASAVQLYERHRFKRIGEPDKWHWVYEKGVESDPE